ncbi:ScbR family autoregulator-binding transcription factor [Streptomyces hundungensis]|uniref:ScbR family autoregulator-binding transcription factor n=1 Tax=Streptomyces hundungensis TaxID=1077946 RepID=UPI0031EFA228
MKQERAVRTRRALLQAASETFERYGYDQARLSDISTGAGVSVGALNFHFKTKAAVAEAVENEAVGTLRRVARATGRHEQALQRLTDISHTLADRLMRDVVARAGLQLSYAAKDRTSLDLLQEWQGCVQQLIAEAADQGSLARTVDQQELAATIVAATTGIEALGRRNSEWLSPPTLTAFWRLMLPQIATEDVLEELMPAGSPYARPEPVPLPAAVGPEDSQEPDEPAEPGEADSLPRRAALNGPAGDRRKRTA